MFGRLWSCPWRPSFVEPFSSCIPSQPDDEEGDGENLFGDDMEADYRANPELDRWAPGGFGTWILIKSSGLKIQYYVIRFDPTLLDEEEYEALSEGERQVID